MHREECGRWQHALSGRPSRVAGANGGVGGGRCEEPQGDQDCQKRVGVWVVDPPFRILDHSPIGQREYRRPRFALDLEPRRAHRVSHGPRGQGGSGSCQHGLRKRGKIFVLFGGGLRGAGGQGTAPDWGARDKCGGRPRVGRVSVLGLALGAPYALRRPHPSNDYLGLRTISFIYYLEIIGNSFPV